MFLAVLIAKGLGCDVDGSGHGAGDGAGAGAAVRAVDLCCVVNTPRHPYRKVGLCGLHGNWHEVEALGGWHLVVMTDTPSFSCVEPVAAAAVRSLCGSKVVALLHLETSC